MPSYRVHRLRDHLKQQFRYAPHLSGVATVKPRDYVAGDVLDASSPYAAYFQMKEAGTPLEVGDVLESGGTLRIFKFVGFEEAQWAVPEVKAEVQEEARTTVLQ
jgi:hypothetical protein